MVQRAKEAEQEAVDARAAAEAKEAELDKAIQQAKDKLDHLAKTLPMEQAPQAAQPCGTEPRIGHESQEDFETRSMAEIAKHIPTEVLEITRTSLVQRLQKQYQAAEEQAKIDETNKADEQPDAEMPEITAEALIKFCSKREGSEQGSTNLNDAFSEYKEMLQSVKKQKK